MELLAALLLLSVSLLAILGLLDIRRPAKYPPGPAWLPVVGSFLVFYRILREVHFTHLAWQRLREQYGPLVGLRLGKDRIVLVSGYPLVKEILSKEECEGRSDGFLFRLRAFGKRLGVVFTDGSSGLKQRRFILKHLKELGLGRSIMVDRITSETRHFISRLYQVHKEGPVDVRRIASVCIFNNVWTLLAGRRFEVSDSRLSMLMDCVQQSFSMQDMTGGLMNQLPFLRHFGQGRKSYNKLLGIIHTIYSFLQDVVEEHKRTLNPAHIRDFIDAFLIEMQNTAESDNEEALFNEEQLMVLLLDMFMAGSDTTSNTMSFVILYLLHHPEIQDLVQQEIGTSGPPTLQERAQLPHLEAVIMEVQRFVSIAPVSIPHRAKTQILVDSYIIPKDVTVLADIYSVHMDTSHWGDPHVFRPARFLDKDNQIVHDEWLIPFSLGRRRCLGETLARPMLFLFLSSLLFHFKLSVPEGQPLPSLEPLDGAILAPRPFTCSLTPRVPCPSELHT